MTSPPPCTHTPPAAPLLSPVISHFMPSTSQEVSKGSRNSAESGMWPTTCTGGLLDNYYPGTVGIASFMTAEG